MSLVSNVESLSVKKKMKKKEKRAVTLNIWDFAGQSVYVLRSLICIAESELSLSYTALVAQQIAIADL